MGYEQAIEIIEEVKKVVKGKDEIIEKVMLAILAKGHVLMEDIPGVGKTTLALSFAKAMDLNQNRMQFTIDVLPSDVVGFSMYNNKTQEFEYKEGAIMANLFLADEINRTSSKTQSSLLEAMEEGQVTVDGVTHSLPVPFTVLATQNPMGSAGTQMLPESQLDRFMIKLSMGYPDTFSEVSILKGKMGSNPLEEVNVVAGAEDIVSMQKQVEEIYVDDNIYAYMVMLCSVTRNHPLIELGVSPRGTVALSAISKAKAYLDGRFFVTPEDVQSVFADVVKHRIIPKASAGTAKGDINKIIKSVIESVPVPRPVSAKRSMK